SGADAGNYTFNTSADTTADITRRALTVTAGSRGKTYGQTVTFAGTEFMTSGLVSGDSIDRVTLTSAGAVATAPVARSPYPITPTAPTATGVQNYAIDYVPGTVPASKASLPITANDLSTVTGAPLPALTASFGGLVNGEDGGVARGLVLATTAT